MDTLSTIRKKLHEVSIPQLSRESGIDFTLIYRIRRGVTQSPTLQTAEALLKAMGYTLEVRPTPRASSTRRRA